MREGLTKMTRLRTETMTEGAIELEALINVPQAAKMLCLSEATIRKWVQLKSIPYRRWGGRCGMCAGAGTASSPCGMWSAVGILRLAVSNGIVPVEEFMTSC